MCNSIMKYMLNICNYMCIYNYWDCWRCEVLLIFVPLLTFLMCNPSSSSYIDNKESFISWHFTILNMQVFVAKYNIPTITTLVIWHISFVDDQMAQLVKAHSLDARRLGFEIESLTILGVEPGKWNVSLHLKGAHCTRPGNSGKMAFETYFKAIFSLPSPFF